MGRIVEFLHREKLPPGTRLAEISLASRLRVSRTPVRAALAHLAQRGVVKRQPRRGYAVAKPLAAVESASAPPPSETDALFLAIARDRIAGHLTLRISEADLMRRYAVGRPILQRALARLAELAVVERTPGHGWHFLPIIADAVARAESYRFRQLVEPAVLLEPGFRLDPGWARDMRRRHEAALTAPWRETSSIAFFEMNAAFHEGLASACGNRYLLLAVQQQNRIRRFLNYDWVFGHERVVVNSNEHLAILDRLEAGDNEVAAALMASHLRRASLLRRASFDGDGT